MLLCFSYKFYFTILINFLKIAQIWVNLFRFLLLILSVAKTYYKNEAGIKAFGNKLRDIRKEKGVSQEALAYKTDLHLSQIGRIERGEVSTSISFVYLFAQVLQVHPKDFFD